jgi:hypothetical protein
MCVQVSTTSELEGNNDKIENQNAILKYDDLIRIRNQVIIRNDVNLSGFLIIHLWPCKMT